MRRSTRGYICVYRHGLPPRRDIRLAETNAKADPILLKFVRTYDADDCYYDWGDDPGFFSATEFLGDPKFASWGVCRPDVRSRIATGDIIVFFCGRQSQGKRWDYFFVGLGTIGNSLSREQIWTDDNYAVYRSFYNILARFDGKELTQKEAMTFHEDWRERARQPYWLFEPDFTKFNLETPLHVATQTPESGPIEIWNTSDSRVRDLEKLLLHDRGISRRLRTTHPQMAHRQIRIDTGMGLPLEALRDELIRRVETYAR